MNGIQVRSKIRYRQLGRSSWYRQTVHREFALSLTTTRSPVYTKCITRKLLQHGNDNVIYAKKKVRSGARYLLYILMTIIKKKIIILDIHNYKNQHSQLQTKNNKKRNRVIRNGVMNLHLLPNDPNLGLKTSSQHLLPLDGTAELNCHLISTSLSQEWPARGNFWLCPCGAVDYLGPDKKELVRSGYRRRSEMYKGDEYASF